jgi:Na+-driven multidrug efflux pump
MKLVTPLVYIYLSKKRSTLKCKYLKNSLTLLNSIILIGGSLAITGIISSSFTTNLWAFIALYGVLNGIGCGMCVRYFSLVINFSPLLVYDSFGVLLGTFPREKRFGNWNN